MLFYGVSKGLLGQVGRFAKAMVQTVDPSCADGYARVHAFIVVSLRAHTTPSCPPQVVCKVLKNEVVGGKRKLILTHKKTLVKSELAVLAEYVTPPPCPPRRTHTHIPAAPFIALYLQTFLCFERVCTFLYLYLCLCLFQRVYQC